MLDKTEAINVENLIFPQGDIAKNHDQDWHIEPIDESDAKETILLATLEMIAEFGIDELTIKKISKQLDMSTGIIHYHYQTKENLLYETFVYFVRRSHERVLNFLRENKDPEMRLIEFSQSQFSEEMLTRSAANIWVYFWYASLSNKRMSRILNIFSKRFVSNLAHCFTHLTNDHKNSQNLAVEYFSLIHGLWIELVITGVLKSSDDALEILQNHIVQIKTKYS